MYFKMKNLMYNLIISVDESFILRVHLYLQLLLLITILRRHTCIFVN